MTALSFTNRYAKPSNFGHPVRNPLLRKHFVYRAYSAAGELLYIGCTLDLKKRLKEHKSAGAEWFPLLSKIRAEGPYNYETARQIEYGAIESERSLFNYSSERREIDRLRNSVVDRYIGHLVAGGMEFEDALQEAVEVVRELIPVDNRAALRVNDLTVASYRRIAEDFVAALGGVA